MLGVKKGPARFMMRNFGGGLYMVRLWMDWLITAGGDTYTVRRINFGS